MRRCVAEFTGNALLTLDVRAPTPKRAYGYEAEMPVNLPLRFGPRRPPQEVVYYLTDSTSRESKSVSLISKSDSTIYNDYAS